jgi:predicted regulator of Ras-like GTPase activity (Roadblock/LC7/MglB family)
MKFGTDRLDAIEKVLQESLIDTGVHSVCLIDMAGNIILDLANGDVSHNVYSLAAVAANNFNAVSEMARLLGQEEFSLLFHKGENESIHFDKVTNDFLLVTLFGKDIPLGYLRLKVTEAISKVKKYLPEQK